MEQKTVHLYVPDAMADWEPGYAVSGINQPTFQQHPGRYVVRTVAATRAPVRTMGGVTIQPDLALVELRPEDSAMLILAGGASWDTNANAGAIEKARAFLAAGVPVAGICGATGGLARAGLLNDRPHTSNAREFLDYQTGYSGAAHYVNAPAHRDGDLITASGTAPVDFARAIFERLELYAPHVLDAWYALYKHNDAAAFYTLAALEEGRA